jgi:hypothetical protein
LEHSEKHIVAEDKLKAVQAELLERLTQMDKLYAKKLERMEDELGKVSLSLVQRASSPSFMESQSKSGKKIQF